MYKDRTWMVLLIGGASGTGKSSLAYEISKYYGVNVMEVDDIHLAVEAVTTKEAFPAIHYWDSGINWKDIGVFGNLQWLRDVSKELMPVLYEFVKRHIEDQVPVIIEGDFIDPELAARFDSSEVKTVFVCEKDKNHIIQNYLSREGGEVQEYRAEISVAYGNWLTKVCEQNDILVVEPKPWNTLMERVLKANS